MKTWKRRLIAVLCCVVLFATSLYVAQPQEAEAAESSGTMTITTKEQGYKLVADGGSGEVNFYYDTKVENYSSYGTNFLDATFISNYITFGGGMTAADLLDGLTTFYVANDKVLQFKWASRTTAFTEGWSFTIAQGALLPYTNTNSETAYMALDKEYTFTFVDGADNNLTNIVRVTSVGVTTWSLASDWGIGTTATTSEINLSDSYVADYVTAYTPIQANEEYRGYLTIDGKDMLELASDAGLEVRTVLDAEAPARALQINAWGSVRENLKTGSDIIIREGMPFYYTDTLGTKWRAELDATYVYTCTGSNTSYSHLFGCVKYNANENVYGLKGTTWTTVAQSTTNTEQYANYYFKTTGVISGAQQSQMLDLALVEEYVDVAGYTVDKAKDMGIIFRFIPNANCIQLGFAAAAVPDLTVGKTITLKKGMPVVFNNNASSATLDATYKFTITANNGTNLTLSMQEFGDDYSLSGTIWNASDDGYATSAYWNATFNSGVFSEDDEFQEGFVTADKEVLADYFYLEGYDTATVLNNGSITLKRYNLSALRGLRVLYQVDKITFTDGMVMMFKEGLPITYTTSYGSTKVNYLDKDYGFVYSASTQTFTYDASLTSESLKEKFEFSAASSNSFYETEKYRTNVSYTSTKEAATETAIGNILTSEGEAGNTADYVDFCGMNSEALNALGAEIKFYPHLTTFQIVWGADALNWVEEGSAITFKEGMPVYYATGDVMYLSETTVYTVSSVSETGFTISRYAESGEYALATSQFGTGASDEAEGNIGIINAETGAADALDDANIMTLTLDTDTISRYVNFCGLTASELASCGTEIRVLRHANAQVFQIHWGTVTKKMAVNDQIIFYEGLPVTYTTTDGMQKNVYLNKTMIFTVAAGNETNTYLLNYTTPESFGLWAIDAVSSNTVAGSADGTEGYYNNIDLYTSDFTKEVTATRYLDLTDDQLNKYVDFAGLSATDYGFSARVIIDSDHDAKVVQLKWGNATSAVKDGDQVVFKKGLSIKTTTDDDVTKIYTLATDYTFTIQAYATGANEYRLVGVQVSETNTAAGDVDGDYLLDKNDISLLKKQLIGLINVSDEHFANANADELVNSADLVYALKTWNEDEQEAYTTLYENVAGTTIAVGNTYTVTLNQDLGTVNYLRLTFDTTQNIYGTFYYTYNGSTYSETFYLAEDEVQFKQFLDNYRENGVLGTTVATNKTLTKISFKNVGSSEATFLLNKVEMAAREFKNGDMLYVENDSIKIGVDLNMGGSLAYYESLQYNPVEYRKTSGAVHIEPEDDCTYTGKGNVNLINIYDLGRQVQQSFYIDLSTDDGYTNGTYTEETWPYNPVQAGDQDNNRSQIVDYRMIDTDSNGAADMIYVKTRAMDWSNPGRIAGGTTTESYMENWYKLSDNLLYVDNAFVDWAGWEYKSVDQVSQELPAFYTGQALNYFVAGNDISTRYANQGSWDDGDSTNNFHVEGDGTSDWYAWVNEDSDAAFGFGICIPNAGACTAGRCVASNSYYYYTGTNRNASNAPILTLCDEYLECTYEYQNCYVMNTSYIAPTKTTILQQYTDYEYTYVLTADYLTTMAQSFEALTVDADEDGYVDMNTGMNSW